MSSSFEMAYVRVFFNRSSTHARVSPGAPVVLLLDDEDFRVGSAVHGARRVAEFFKHLLARPKADDVDSETRVHGVDEAPERGRTSE